MKLNVVMLNIDKQNVQNENKFKMSANVGGVLQNV